MSVATATIGSLASAAALAQAAVDHHRGAAMNDMHPVWVVTLLAVIVLPVLLFAFLALHLVVTVLLMGRPYEFPIKVASRGPWYCPHCGKATARKRIAPGPPQSENVVGR